MVSCVFFAYMRKVHSSIDKIKLSVAYILLLMNCKKTWMIGSLITTMSGLIKEKCAVARHQCKLYLRAKKSGRKS